MDSLQSLLPLCSWAPTSSLSLPVSPFLVTGGLLFLSSFLTMQRNFRTGDRLTHGFLTGEGICVSVPLTWKDGSGSTGMSWKGKPWAPGTGHRALGTKKWGEFLSKKVLSWFFSHCCDKMPPNWVIYKERKLIQLMFWRLGSPGAWLWHLVGASNVGQVSVTW